VGVVFHLAQKGKGKIRSMAYKSGQAGKSTREMAKKRRQSAIWIFVFGIAFVIVLWVFLHNSKALGIGGIGILVILVLMRVVPDIIDTQMSKKLKEEKRAIRGAKGEERIGELLEGLSGDFCVLHDIESPYGNIDHIVIGKNAGIFLLETKAHGGRVEVNGETLLVNGKIPEKDFIAQALRNSYWLRDAVSQIVGAKPWITPILVFTNAFVVSNRPIKGVDIINKKYLLPFLQKTSRPNALNEKVWLQRKSIVNRLM
jgi:Nuclease-related domain